MGEEIHAGVDLTPAQLATARRCQQRSGIFFPLIEADAGDVPLPSASFDRASGFAIDDLREICAPPDATDHP